MPSSYSPQLVVLSILIACVASYAALFFSSHVANTSRARLGWLIAGGTAMGTGIWSMHSIAMLAFQLPVRVAYDVPLVGLSLATAIVGSLVGLQAAGTVQPSRTQLLIAGPLMAAGVAGMHYLGMAALRLPASMHYDLRIVGASLGVALIVAYVAIALLLRFRFDNSRRSHWLRVASAIVMGHAIAAMHYSGMAAAHFERAPFAGSGRPILPPQELAIAIAISTLLILTLLVGGAMLDRSAQAMRSARENEERFRIMVDAVEDHAIFTLDASGRVASWNRGAEKILGHQAAAILGRPLNHLYPAELAAEADRELSIARTVGRYEGESVRASADDPERFLNITTAAMRDEAGALIGFARIVRDVTERRQGEEELRHRERQLRQAHKMEAVGQLAGGVAHDFNNMLTAIRGYTEVLLNDPSKDGPTRDALEEIRKATERAASLTRQLLAFSRKQVLQPRPVNPNAVVREMESMLRRLLVGDVELTTVLERDVGQITVDPAQLEQVLLNLVVNARDAMSDRGRIVIRTSNVELDAMFCHLHEGARLGPHVRLSVSDSGIGMSDETKRHIFEPFFTTKKRGAGTGLGLSTVYGIVKQSGGYITLDSEMGHGTVFRVYFPRTQAAAVPLLRPPVGANQAYRQGTVLLVDDEDSVRRVLTALIERLGYEVLAATDGIQALEVSRTYRGTIDLLITDIMMPRMHGRELSERLAETRPETRVLFTSGYADDDIIERGLLSPHTAFIQKPFSIDELSDKMRATLARNLIPAG